MIKPIILIICLATLSSCVSLQRFLKIEQECSDQRKIAGGLPGSAQCEYDNINNKLQDKQCGKDYYKSLICATTFKQCTELSMVDQYPYVCYLCWVKSPATSALYQSFQKCIADRIWEPILLSKIFMALMLLVFMYIM